MAIYLKTQSVFSMQMKLLFFNAERKKSRIANDEKECLTTLVTANAAGMLAPPMVVFPYERLPGTISMLMPDGWSIGKSETGWMTSQTFYEYVANVMHPWIVKNQIPLPVVFFVDGHSSHLTLPLSNFCTDNGIILIALYPNSTHILQPMDVAVFHPLKSGWKTAVYNWMTKNSGQKLKREQFGPLLKQVFDDYIKPETIANGFKKCGLFPLNENAINYTQLFNKCDRPLAPSKLPKETLKMHLNFLESRIEISKLETFKKSGENWVGIKEDTSMFLLWNNIRKELKETTEETSRGKK